MVNDRIPSAVHLAAAESRSVFFIFSILIDLIMHTYDLRPKIQLLLEYYMKIFECKNFSAKYFRSIFAYRLYSGIH